MQSTGVYFDENGSVNGSIDHMPDRVRRQGLHNQQSHDTTECNSASGRRHKEHIEL